MYIKINYFTMMILTDISFLLFEGKPIDLSYPKWCMISLWKNTKDPIHRLFNNTHLT